jgi:hypothetical protein
MTGSCSLKYLHTNLYATLIPPFTSADYERLKASIKEQGDLLMPHLFGYYLLNYHQSLLVNYFLLLIELVDLLYRGFTAFTPFTYLGL